jgi:peptidoglycan hydrolase FlgJ
MRIENAGGPTQAAETKADPKLKKVCQDFDTIFLGFMLKSMRKTVTKSELFDSGPETGIFRDMMDEEFCKASSRTRSMGIADMLYKQLDPSIERNELRGEKQ